MKHILLISILSIVLFSPLYSQDFKGNFSIGYSEGVNINSNNAFYGVAFDYSHPIKNTPLSFGVGLMWDEEKKEVSDIGTFTLAVSLSYLITERWTIGTGLANGFASNENTKKEYQLGSKDISTGVTLTYNFTLLSKHHFSITNSLEYNITNKEYSFSIDLNYILPW